nr:hypothetical protein Itr_chr12CG11060 [Ipomoea trifida]
MTTFDPYFNSHLDFLTVKINWDVVPNQRLTMYIKTTYPFTYILNIYMGPF